MAQQSVHQLYRRLETIGKGAYGSVHKGLHIPTGNIVALKIINLDTPDDDVEDIQREVTLLTQLRDAPNVTKYFGCYLDGPRVWIIMEHAQGGSVRDLMKVTKDGTLEEKYVVIIVREVLLGLAYLHKSAIIHRDIKAANILITAAGKVMICDFGVSALLATASSKRNTLMGTPNWMAPEVAQTVPAYDTRADIWSLGIMIYEMVKGSPPHAGIDRFKVMHLIPRVAPPRLHEGEGSKDMRDFVSYCLRESPNDRLSADELTKTKWIKTVSKVPVIILKDLILRYESWKHGGGVRDSLAGPLDWEEEEEKDLQVTNDGDDDRGGWEFETVRRRTATEHSLGDSDGHELEESSHLRTIRPPASSKLPSSLRALFGDETPANQGIDLSSLHVGSAALAPSTPSPGRDGGFLGGLRPHGDNDSNVHTARPNNFRFPPRPTSRFMQGKAPGGASGSEDEDLAKSRPSPGTVFGKVHAPELDSRPGSSSGISKSVGSYREVRSNRGFPNIEIPPLLPSGISAERVPHMGASPAATTLSRELPVPPVGPTANHTVTRKRSQSSTPTSGPYSGSSNQKEATFAPRSDFHFPPASITGVSRAHSRISPTHISISSPVRSSLVVHHSTYSLDAAGPLQPRRPPPSGPLPRPPSLTRTRSANAINESTVFPVARNGELPTSRRKPSLSRQSSVAVMENVDPHSSLTAPVRPFARTRRDRSGSSGRSDGNISGSSAHGGMPGLKDVLKIPTVTSDYQIGMPDLLPPSPSAVMYNHRNYVPSQTLLSSSAVPTDQNGARGAPSNGLPSPFRPVSPDRSFGAEFTRQNSDTQDGAAPLGAQGATLGPAIRPLDFGALMVSQESTHAALAQTVDDLAQWLSVVELGLSGILDQPYGDAIEEEQEAAIGDDSMDSQMSLRDPGPLSDISVEVTT